MKYIFYPLIIISVLVAIYIYVRLVISRIYFKFDLAGIDVTQLQGSKVNVKINSYIQNDNIFPITFSNIFVQLYRSNQLIASSVSEDNNKYIVQPSGKFIFQDDIQIFVNPTTTSMVVDIIAKKPVSIEYIVKVKLWGISIPAIKSNFII